MEWLFAFFFKYPPLFFQKGDVTFQWALKSWQMVGLLLLLAALLLFLYRGRRAFRPGGNPGWLLPGVRAAFFLVLALLLMRPALVLSTLIPKENLLATLVDNSRSMGIPVLGVPRGQPVEALLAPDSDFVSRLDEKFYLRFFRFDSSAERVESPLTMDWSGEQTNIVGALQRVLAATENLPLGGILLFSDGSDNSYRDVQATLQELKARRIPVHTIGVGPESLGQDIEITQVSAPRTSIPETVSVARITFRHRGFGGQRGRLEIREGNVLVRTEEIYFPRDAETFTVDTKFIPKTEGVKTYSFSLKPLEGEEIEQNNSRMAVMRVRPLASRILYVEGRPRWEYKFIRRALAEDKHLSLETLLRTALNKFYRQGIQDETTLATGFPTDREELFQYQGIVFGSVESSFFTYPQMEMVRDFVGKRGGGFLMLGGSASFSAGEYQNTPVEEILPVWLRGEEDEIQKSLESLYRRSEASLRVTERGRQHPALQLSLEAGENDGCWNRIPALSDWNQVRGTKPGAVVLARLQIAGQADLKDPQVPLLVFQRYGRGQSLALLTGSSWRWQMLQDHQDQSHETFWRQLLRWVVNSAKDPVSVETERETYARNEVVNIRAEINDPAFNRINDARVEAHLTAPSGETFSFPMQWDSREDGVYRGQWSAREDGLHLLQIQAEGNSVAKQGEARADTSFLTSAGNREYFDAVQKKDFLKRLAHETGGNYYTLANVEKLPDEILYTEAHSSQIEVLDLWDMPLNFFLLIGLLFTEWVVRKRHGVV